MQSLLNLAEREQIAITYDNIAKRFKTLGLYDSDGVSRQIILHAELKSYPRLHKCILSEELGHHFTSVGASFYKAANCRFWKLNHIKTELRALKWSCFYLIPDGSLRHAIHTERLRAIEEFEDYFEVTPELLLFRLRYVKNPDFLDIDSLLQREERHILKLAETLADTITP
ncbi:MAG: hypothetical protein LBP78_05630 [Acidaminococcales bacterium]|jgi:hypothetical protein|nr:hypothetical protein [Acidaminococcales bacterium]